MERGGFEVFEKRGWGRGPEEEGVLAERSRKRDLADPAGVL